MSLQLRDGDAFLDLDADRAVAGTAWCWAEVALALGPHELSRLSAAIRRLDADGHGSALWSNDGGEVRLEIVMAKRGETHLSLRLQSPPDFLQELRLVFVGRQDELAALADALA